MSNLTEKQVQDLAEEALNAACFAIQTALGVTDGMRASIFFSGSDVKEKFIEYINSEIKEKSDEIDDLVEGLLFSRDMDGTEFLLHSSTDEAKSSLEWAKGLIKNGWDVSDFVNYKDITSDIENGTMFIYNGIASEIKQ